MQNTLLDLNNNMFEALERLNDNDMVDTPEKLIKEVARAKAMSLVAGTIINNARLVLDAQIKLDDGLTRKIPEMLATNKEKEENGIPT